jgi:DNA replication and repair protein RecF
MAAELCSTGEQKALLISIFLTFASEMKKEYQQAPIVLLDELIAHLDIERKNQLFFELEKLTSQVFMTGTEKHLFDEIKEKSFFIDL